MYILFFDARMSLSAVDSFINKRYNKYKGIINIITI